MVVRRVARTGARGGQRVLTNPQSICDLVLVMALPLEGVQLVWVCMSLLHTSNDRFVCEVTVVTRSRSGRAKRAPPFWITPA
jgi:hypothetical protein